MRVAGYAISGLLVLSVPFVQGCSSSSTPTCTLTSTGYSTCIQFLGSYFTPSNVQDACYDAGGNFSNSSTCAAGNAGSCTIGAGTANEAKLVYTAANGGGCPVGDGGTLFFLEELCVAANGGLFTCP